MHRTIIVNNTYYHHSTADDNLFLPTSYNLSTKNVSLSRMLKYYHTEEKKLILFNSILLVKGQIKLHHGIDRNGKVHFVIYLLL